MLAPFKSLESWISLFQHFSIFLNVPVVPFFPGVVLSRLSFHNTTLSKECVPFSKSHSSGSLLVLSNLVYYTCNLWPQLIDMLRKLETHQRHSEEIIQSVTIHKAQTKTNTQKNTTWCNSTYANTKWLGYWLGSGRPQAEGSHCPQQHFTQCPSHQVLLPERAILACWTTCVWKFCKWRYRSFSAL